MVDLKGGSSMKIMKDGPQGDEGLSLE